MVETGQIKQRTGLGYGLQVLVCTILFLSLSGLQAAEDFSPQSIEFFEKKIRPVLVERCYECHTEKEKGGLRLDSRRRVLKGGDSGPAVVPGKPGESLLIEAIHYGADSYQMPPKGKLPADIVKDLERWVQLSLPWPTNTGELLLQEEGEGYVVTAEQKAFWSFQPVVRPDTPSVKHSDWPNNDIDRFVLRHLEDKRYSPAKKADKRTLLRRATFDLTGLPPKPQEVTAFLEDESEGAFARVIDRLLDSPRYGERWARHWLDGVRYMSDVGYYNFSDLGWRYRDWVIDALNADMPYDDFVTYQIAGDLVPPPHGGDRNARGIIATGVFAMGNVDDQESEKEKLYSELIDDQIDLVGRQFLGLTIACARCHDHKFDPIPTEDYYSLGGIFMSSRVFETSSRIGAKRNALELSSDRNKEVRKEYQAQIARVEAELKTAEEQRANLESIDRLRRKLRELRFQIPHEGGKAIGLQEGGHDNSRHKDIGDMSVYIRGNPYRLGDKAPRRFLRILSEDNRQTVDEVTQQSGRLQLARWISNEDNPLTARVMVNRVWQYHFGEGLVRTPSNFGKLGLPPSHPKLLDYLASRFVESGWSLKEMHRLIMNSATYQQAGQGSSRLEEEDPENLLLGRFQPRRLTAEEIHDSLLAVGGTLKNDIGKGNRAIYSKVGHMHPFLVAKLFDAPTPGTIVPARDQSTTAPQALYMMNDAKVIQASRAFEKRLKAQSESLEGQIELAYRIAYGRAVTPKELKAGRAFLEEQSEERRWTYFQVLLCASEFVYID